MPAPKISIYAFDLGGDRAKFRTIVESSETMKRALVHAWENGAAFAVVRFMPADEPQVPADPPTRPTPTRRTPSGKRQGPR